MDVQLAHVFLILSYWPAGLLLMGERGWRRSPLLFSLALEAREQEYVNSSAMAVVS